MNKPTIIFILNPIAGKGLKVSKTHIEEKFSDKNVEFIEVLEGREKIVKEAIKNGVLDFVVVGGDGTVNNIAALIMNTPARLGIVPNGSGNGLARDLGIPMNIEASLERIKTGKIKKIDVGLINQMPFFCTAGIGFDAICAYNFAHKSHNRGLWNYVKIILSNYYAFKPISVKIDGVKREFFSITFANAEQYGNNAYIAPFASIDDGIIDCSLILPHPKNNALRLGWTLMRRKLGSFKYFESQKGKTFKLEEISDQRIHIDGESIQLNETTIEINILEKALKVFV